MAGGQERTLRRRVKSFESMKKITRAMELIAAAQMARAQARIKGSRPYVEGIGAVLAETAADRRGGNASRLIGSVESPSAVLVVAIAADRGLCGGYNNGVLRATEHLIAAGAGRGTAYRLVTVGKKSIGYFRFRNQPVEQSFTGFTDRPTYEDARRLAAAAIRPFLDEEVDMVQLVSTRFLNAASQVVEVRQILPLLPADEDGTPATPRAGYVEFEPTSEDLLGLLIREFTEAALYAALLEASASEHTARQRAMSAATENAEELITNLRRVMNRARQDAITTEIMEIVGGAEALRGGTAGDSGPDNSGRDNDGNDEIIEERIA
jgi:F-type H+-transporting ATPase subunit gamma